MALAGHKADERCAWANCGARFGDHYHPPYSKSHYCHPGDPSLQEFAAERIDEWDERPLYISRSHFDESATQKCIDAVCADVSWVVIPDGQRAPRLDPKTGERVRTAFDHAAVDTPWSEAVAGLFAAEISKWIFSRRLLGQRMLREIEFARSERDAAIARAEAAEKTLAEVRALVGGKL